MRHIALNRKTGDVTFIPQAANMDDAVAQLIAKESTMKREDYVIGQVPDNATVPIVVVHGTQYVCVAARSD